MSRWDVQTSAEKGRHIVATSSFQPGDTILRQDPYQAVLYDDQLAVRCDATLCTSQEPLLRCGGCRVVHYCNRAAQKQAWAGWHKAECTALAAAAPRLPPPTVRLAARVLWKKLRQAGEGGGTVKAGEAFSDIAALEDHWQELPDEKKTAYAQMAALTRHYMTCALRLGAASPMDEPAAEDGLPSNREIALLLARFGCNNHTICDEELRPLGVGIYPLGALINHSCTPNAVQAFDGSAILFRAVRAIAPGEEVVISYISLADSRPARRQALLESYFFDIDNGVPMAEAAEEVVSGSGVQLRWHHRPPSLLDDRDLQLTGLTSASPAAESSPATGSGAAAFIPGCGVMASTAPPASQTAGSSFEGLSINGLTQDPDIDSLRLGSGPAPSQRTGPALEAASQPFEAALAGAGNIQGSSSSSSSSSSSRLRSGGANNSAAEASRNGSCAEPEVWVTCWGPAENRAAVVATAEAAGQLWRALLAGERSLSKGKHSKAVHVLEAALRQADVPASGLQLCGMHLVRVRLQEALLRAAIADGSSWELALRTAQQLLPFYQLVYPGVWPDLGLHWATVAKLAALQQRPREAVAAAAEAFRVISLTCGGGGGAGELLAQLRGIAQDAALALQREACSPKLMC